jgi:hypothetical protein
VNNSAVGFLIAGQVNGDVTPLFGAKEAAIFGTLFGVAVGVILWLKDRFGKVK